MKAGAENSFLKTAVKTSSCIFIILILFSVSSCSDEIQSSNTGKVLLAEVSGDTVSATLGTSTRSKGVSQYRLDVTDRDSIEISFTYSGNSNNSSVPFRLSYLSGTNDSAVYSSAGLILNSSEQSITVTVPSPKVKEYFFYTIKVTAGGGFGFFRFRDLKIYKK